MSTQVPKHMCTVTVHIHIIHMYILQGFLGTSVPEILNMFIGLSLLSFVAAHVAAHVTPVPLARPVLRHQHLSAVPPHPSEPLLPAPDRTTAPYPQQQTPPPSEPRPPAPQTTRPPFLSREPDFTTSPPTPATPYPTQHTLFRSEPNQALTLPDPQSKTTYFHIPVHINPIIHAPHIKKKNRTRSTPSRRTHVPQLSALTIPLT